MSGTFPSSPGFVSNNFKSTAYNLSSTSVSGRTQVRGIGSQRWEFTVAFPPMSRSEYGPVNAFLLKQRGMLESFQIVLPIVSDKSSGVSGPVVSGTASIGATACNITGLTGTMKAGDVIKFASHNKVYMLTADRAGDGAIAFEPPLMAAVTAAAVTYDAVPFTVRLNNDVQQFNFSVDGTVAYEIDMIEVI